MSLIFNQLRVSQISVAPDEAIADALARYSMLVVTLLAVLSFEGKEKEKTLIASLSAESR